MTVYTIESVIENLPCKLHDRQPHMYYGVGTELSCLAVEKPSMRILAVLEGPGSGNRLWINVTLLTACSIGEGDRCIRHSLLAITLRLVWHTVCNQLKLSVIGQSSHQLTHDLLNASLQRYGMYVLRILTAE